MDMAFPDRPIVDDGHPRLHRLDSNTIVKRARSQKIQRELEAMEFVRDHTTIPIPAVFEARFDDGLGELFMELLPGNRLDLTWPSLDPDARETTRTQLKGYFDQLRSISQPSPGWIGSCVRGPAYDHRLNNGFPCGPFDSENDFNGFLVKPVLRCPNPERAAHYLQLLSTKHHVYFSHADICYSNILVDVDTGDVTGIIDWEMAGWWP
jgi:aminoglycoside phosphotransferase (APT) family kinase protein